MTWQGGSSARALGWHKTLFPASEAGASSAWLGRQQGWHSRVGFGLVLSSRVHAQARHLSWPCWPWAWPWAGASWLAGSRRGHEGSSGTVGTLSEQGRCAGGEILLPSPAGSCAVPALQLGWPPGQEGAAGGDFGAAPCAMEPCILPHSERVSLEETSPRAEPGGARAWSSPASRPWGALRRPLGLLLCVTALQCALVH